MKKIILLSIAVIVVVSLVILPSCKEPETVVETVTETVVETVTETVEVENGEKGGVTLVFTSYPHFIPANDEHQDMLIEQWMEITGNVVYINRVGGEELVPKVAAELNAGVGSDIVVVQDVNVHLQYSG